MKKYVTALLIAGISFAFAFGDGICNVKANNSKNCDPAESTPKCEEQNKVICPKKCGNYQADCTATNYIDIEGMKKSDSCKEDITSKPSNTCYAKTKDPCYTMTKYKCSEQNGLPCDTTGTKHSNVPAITKRYCKIQRDSGPDKKGTYVELTLTE